MKGDKLDKFQQPKTAKDIQVEADNVPDTNLTDGFPDFSDIHIQAQNVCPGLIGIIFTDPANRDTWILQFEDNTPDTDKQKAADSIRKWTKAGKIGKVIKPPKGTGGVVNV